MTSQRYRPHMTEYGVAWLSAYGTEVGSTGGVASVDDGVREGLAGLQGAYPRASKAVVYRGRTLSEGTVLHEVERPRRGQ